jgi:uncharacterized protein GlcG (DUF336 family)
MLTLAEASTIVDAALAAGRRLGITVCVAACDRQGRLIVFKCMDGTYREAGRLAIGKAVAAASTGLPSGDIVSTPEYPSAALVVGEGMPVNRIRGGLPIRRKGEIVGGCGVTGAPSNEVDEECAKAGVAAFPD